jgi:membrane-bound lytic murein transglycosylase B
MVVAVSAMWLSAQEPERPSFETWLGGVRQEALERGIKPDTVARAFDGLTPLEVVVERDRTQAETVLTVDEYVRRRLTTRFVRTANEKAVAERRTLARVGARYDVQPRFLVAVWGLESNFGRFSGVRPVVQALATLAWEGRRGTFFKGELMQALEIVDRGHIELGVMKGSWAGAMGQTQFMPSSYLNTPRTSTATGIGTSGVHADVLASIANYLRTRLEGRKRGARGSCRGAEDRLMAGWGPSPGAGPTRDDRAGKLDVAEAGETVVAPCQRWTATLRCSGRARRPGCYALITRPAGYNCAHAYALAGSQLADRSGASRISGYAVGPRSPLSAASSPAPSVRSSR